MNPISAEGDRSHSFGSFSRRLSVAIAIVAMALISTSGCGDSSGSRDSESQRNHLGDGSSARPLRVMLIPADGGTEDGTRADFQPIFNSIAKEYDLHFDIRVGSSYTVVVEGMVNEKVDIAFFGPLTYHIAKRRGAAELLAVAVTNGESVYYSGIFVRKDAGINSLEDLRGKAVAFGDVNSTSSFNFPVAMLLEASIDPIDDLGKVHLTDGHASALAMLAAGKVDAACASYSSFEKAVSNGQVDPARIKPVAKSDPIPFPPLAMHVKLPDELKKTLRHAFNHVHEAEGVTPDMIRGYGGKRVDRYNADFSEEEFNRAIGKLAKVTDELKQEMLKKAAQN